MPRASCSRPLLRILSLPPRPKLPEQLQNVLLALLLRVADCPASAAPPLPPRLCYPAPPLLPRLSAAAFPEWAWEESLPNTAHLGFTSTPCLGNCHNMLPKQGWRRKNHEYLHVNIFALLHRNKDWKEVSGTLTGRDQRRHEIR